MHITQTQLEQVDRQVSRLLEAGNFYGERLKQAGIDHVTTEEDFLKLPFSEKNDLKGAIIYKFAMISGKIMP